MAVAARDYFLEKNDGHIVAITSIAGLRGSSAVPIYSASKAFASNYLAGLRAYFNKINKNIYVTTVQPGFVDTAMAKSDKKFWVATPEKAAVQIGDAIEYKKKLVYVTKRWRIVAWLYKILPDCFFYWLT